MLILEYTIKGFVSVFDFLVAVFVVIFNFVASKLVIFRKKGEKDA